MNRIVFFIEGSSLYPHNRGQGFSLTLTLELPSFLVLKVGFSGIYGLEVTKYGKGRQLNIIDFFKRLNNLIEGMLFFFQRPSNRGNDGTHKGV